MQFMSERNSHPLLKPLSVISDDDAYVNAMLRLACVVAQRMPLVAGKGWSLRMADSLCRR
jgi:hypothetical protein